MDISKTLVRSEGIIEIDLRKSRINPNSRTEGITLFVNINFISSSKEECGLKRIFGAE